MTTQTKQTADPISAALFKAVGDIPPIKANATNPAFKRNGKATPYVTLDSLIDQVRPHLRKHGLDQRHVIGNADNGAMRVAFEVFDSSGATRELASQQFVISPGAKEQDLGRAITYLRRATILCGLGLAVEFDSEDMDGNTPATSKGAAPTAPADGW